MASFLHLVLHECGVVEVFTGFENVSHERPDIIVFESVSDEHEGEAVNEREGGGVHVFALRMSG